MKNPELLVDALRNAQRELEMVHSWIIDDVYDPVLFQEGPFFTTLSKHIQPLLETESHKALYLYSLKAKMKGLKAELEYLEGKSND